MVGQAPFGWELSLSPPPGHPLPHIHRCFPWGISVLNKLGFQVLQQLWPFLAQGRRGRWGQRVGECGGRLWTGLFLFWHKEM